MNFDFNNKIDNFLKTILKNALLLDIRVFFVGGIVRDKILNVKTADIDLLILGNAIEFSKTLPNEIKIKSIHKDFATVKVEYDGLEIDIASSRAESYPFSGCLPVVDVVGVELEKDVLRRDFSINSLYFELFFQNDEIKYELIDLVQGVKDIQNKTLRVLHNKSYIDDPTRILRGLGFKHRFGFEFSELDEKLIDEYLSKIDYSNMSYDRNLKVFRYVLSNDFQDEIFSEIIEKKYYKILSPNGLSVDFTYLRKIFEKFDLDKCAKCEIFINILENKNVEKVECDSTLDIYKNFSKISRNDLIYSFYKTKDENILKYFEIKDIKLNLAGADLLELGFKQGREIGEMLDDLLKNKLENPDKFKEKLDEISWIKNRFPQK